MILESWTLVQPDIEPQRQIDEKSICLFCCPEFCKGLRAFFISQKGENQNVFYQYTFPQQHGSDHETAAGIPSARRRKKEKTVSIHESGLQLQTLPPLSREKRLCRFRLSGAEHPAGMQRRSSGGSRSIHVQWGDTYTIQTTASKNIQRKARWWMVALSSSKNWISQKSSNYTQIHIALSWYLLIMVSFICLVAGDKKWACRIISISWICKTEAWKKLWTGPTLVLIIRNQKLSMER